MSASRRWPSSAAPGCASPSSTARPSAAGGGASAPDYEVGLRYYENGVADELQMEFGEFSVNGKMQELSLLPNPC